MLEAEIGSKFSDNDAPALPVRLIAGMMYLQQAKGLSDEAIVDCWVENSYWQYFCGETFFVHDFPCDSTSLTRWRQRLVQVAHAHGIMFTSNL